MKPAPFAYVRAESFDQLAQAHRIRVERRHVTFGVPNRAGLHERIAERAPFELDPLGQKRVAVDEGGDRTHNGTFFGA